MRQLKISKSITNRDSESLDKYLQDIGRVDLLTVDEEVSLAQRIRKGDQEALEKLTEANLRFVVSVAKQYQHQGLSLPDLINEGNLGLMKAAKKFDETRGFKFISYAVWWIRQSILQALAEQSRIVRLPLNQVGAVNKIYRFFAEFQQIYNREPTNQEISEELNITTKKIDQVLKAAGKHMSMDAPLTSDSDSNRLVDIMENEGIDPSDNMLMKESLLKEIERALSTLPEREAIIIKHFFGVNGEELSLREIGDKLGLTRERVRQLKERALRKLRKSSRSKHLKTFLG
ncbi:MAG: sigma-70 family RNA polymerase sigma factor [Bacteroidales bacterium]|nr:sigma-70 family RNA polymerase sigma factor [Bacteroidales bacterium]NOZ33764.1 sigma-70 family RNA polymerase sigma factor [Chlorobiota bacterium]